MTTTNVHDDMSTEERILHYQRGIDRSVTVLDKERLLHCIKALSKLPVTMKHLKSTGIGRTVNSLRKIEDGVGDASKRLVTKWKQMVSAASDSGESDEACKTDDPNNYQSVNDDQKHNSPTDTMAVENDNHNNGINRPEALEEKPVLSPPMVIDINISPEEPAPNLSDEDEKPEETNDNQSSKHSSSKDKDTKKDSKPLSSNQNSDSKEKKESLKVTKNSKDNGQEEQKKKDKEKNKSKSESSSNKEKKYSSELKKRKVDSSDDESNRKKQRLSVCENESDNEEDPNNFVIDNDEGVNQESSSDEHDSEVRESSKDRHKESSLKHSDSKSKSKDKRSRSSSISSSSSKTKSHESKNKEERKKDDKNKSKSSHSSSSGKDANGKEKDKHSKDDKEKSKNEEKGKVKDKKEHKKSKEHKEKKKSKKSTIESIDSMSGTSFADALGMCSMPPPKKKKENSSKSNKSDQPSTSSPQSSPSKPSPSKSKTEYRPTSPNLDSPEESPSLLLPNVQLEPLADDINEEVDLASTLPEPSPYYKPLPQLNHVQRRFDEEAMLSQVINAKVQRTKVYSGNKSGWTTVPSLQEVCIRLLIENIDALEYTGGVPFDILQPILERASADQLQRLEYFNPYLVEETDNLWKFHCNKIFKTKQREEMESWRDMYERCVSEREAKFKAITANIKQSIDKSAPVRSTKLAYVDHFVKPPRNVLRQQAKYGTAKVATSASDLKKKLITGAAGPSSSSSGSSSANAERIAVPPPPLSRVRPPSSHPIKKVKAPLMAKALQAIKGRYKR